MLLPGRELSARGHRVRVIRAGERVALPRLAIFGKLSNSDAALLASQIRANLEWARAAKTAGTLIVADFCDNHFGDALRGDYARGLLALSDAAVTSTALLRDLVAAQTKIPVGVIPDPVEGPGGAPRFSPPAQRAGLLSRLMGKAPQQPAPLQLLWFGHQSGLPALQAFLPELEAAGAASPLALEIVCASGFGGEELAAAPGRTGKLAARFTPWSLAATWSALARCDLVILPALASEAARSTKSANRLTEALRAGRYVLAHAVPSYEEYRECAWVSEDLVTGLRWAMRNPELVLTQIANGQRQVRERLLPTVVAARWESLLGDVAATRAAGHQVMDEPAAGGSAARMAQEGQLKLNLCCGDKILPGYVNVDVAASRNGARPDVLCDLRDLSAFASGSADEILSVHVVEHFWRWEVDAIIAEWARVLKPGGRMIVECPNLAAACEALLANPDVGPGAEGNRSMWVLYGDPAWRDPLMCHRWGYTPQTLMRLLSNAGLAEVRQEPAQFKMREPRDMRVVGVKPR